MSSVAVLVVLPFFLQTIDATFPPVNNPPPIPGPAIRTLDIPGQQVYVQGDIQSNLPQTVIKEEGYFQSEPKIDDQRWYITENQSGEIGDVPTSTETFDRYYSNGLPAVGPVATPLPDDTYIAQPSGTSKIIPDVQGNVGSSDIWVLTKGPNDQYIPERWIQVQVPVTDERIVEVVNQDEGPKLSSQVVKSSFPPPPLPLKSSGPPVAPANVQQIWVKAPPPPQPIQSQKIVQNTATIVEEVRPVKQYLDVPQPTIKQYVQPQIVKEAQPLPPPPSVISQKSSSFVVPPPPPPPVYKGVDIASPKQTVVVNQPVGTYSEKSSGITVGKNGVLQQVKHIWIPTSQQTGKFITVPAGTVGEGIKSIQSKGIPMDIAPPVAVSDTWVLKQDGPAPRFEQQKSIPGPVIQNGNVLVAEAPIVQFESPKNPPLIGKSIDTAVPADIWPVRKDLPDPNIIVKAGGFPPVLSPPQVKSDAVVSKIITQDPILQQKTLIPAGKFQQLPPPPLSPVVAPLSPIAQVIKGKPCPIGPQKSPFSPKSIPVPTYRTVAAINRQPFTRIIRLNRYPYGSYYVLNPRMGPSLYSYPRPILQQTRNGVVRLVSARHIGVPFPVRQVAVPVPRRPTVLSIPPVKPVSTLVQPQIIYPPLPAVSRLRYTYPWGSYLRSLPVAGKNVMALPPIKPARLEVSSSSSSSESSSSSSESKSSESKSKPKSKPKEAKKKKEIESEGLESEASEPPPEPETEPVEEQEASESAPVEILESQAEMEEEVTSTESETEGNMVAEESQLRSQFANRPFNTLVKEHFGISDQPYLFGYDFRDRTGTTQPRKETVDSSGRFVGSYGFSDQNRNFRNVAYAADDGGFKAHVVNNEADTVSHMSADANFIANTSPESTTAQSKAYTVDEKLESNLRD